MVKKRFPKKYVKISSDESDSDDFYEEEPTVEAEPKKYSLRQRRGANFAEDFDYDVLEENDKNIAPGTEALHSDDEDFDLIKSKKEEITTNTESGTQSKPKNIANTDKASTSNCTIIKYKERELEPEIPHDKQSSDAMIDFEDVIRADILVNNGKIDYDSIIEKTEIQINKKNPEENENKPIIEKTIVKLNKNGELPKKRGRKPKNALLGGVNDPFVKRKYKKQKLEEDTYQTYTHDTAGLPINTVLGVTESLYELAERYHLQGGMMVDEMAAVPLEPILNESISTELTKNTIHGGDEVSLQQPEASSGAIEIY